MAGSGQGDAHLYSSEDGTVARHPKLSDHLRDGRRKLRDSASASARHSQPRPWRRSGQLHRQLRRDALGGDDQRRRRARGGQPTALSRPGDDRALQLVGNIDARNGGDYVATSSIAYAGERDVSRARGRRTSRSHTYWIYVTAAGWQRNGSSAAGFAFRSEQANGGELERLGRSRSIRPRARSKRVQLHRRDDQRRRRTTLPRFVTAAAAARRSAAAP